ncbi:MAG: hypothetical protein JSR93_01330 [Verrucomicrobia bacterium]|nr:hypothetical protein [Verrucomicrobiota bacterium]
MKQRQPKPKQIPLVHALAWIVGSALLVSGTSHLCIKHFMKNRSYAQGKAPQVIQTMVQTGPQREALKTEYLAELLGISADFPPLAANFDLKAAELKLRACPLIADAQVKLLKPSTLYVDYTIRQPVAWAGDYENIAIDKAGYLFPFRPFFSPKNLPEIYMGLGPFGEQSEESDKPVAEWNQPLAGKYAELALNLLNLLNEPQVQELFTVKRIDVSKAFSESYGTREIILIAEDLIPINSNGKQIQYLFPKILRLSTKNYAAELGNYLKLRPQLIENQRAGIKLSPDDNGTIRQKETIIDFRIPNLAFIDEQKKAP